MLPGVLFPLPLVACCSMLVFLLWPWRAKKGALKWFLFAWPVLGWEWTVGITASPCATARICRHIRYYLTSSDDLSQRWFIACTHLYHSSFDSSQCLITCMPYIRATAVTVAVAIMRLKAPAMLILLPLLMSTICFFVAGFPENCYT